MAPKRLPWSVSAIAGNLSSLALSTSFSSWAAPSSRLYSEWTWRWTNSLCCMAHFRALFQALFPLDGGGRLRRDVEHDPIDALHLVDDPVADRAQELIRQSRPVRGHRVLAHDGAQRDDVRVGPEVAHDTDGPDGQEDREGLPHRPLEAGGAHFFLHDGVGLAQQVEPFRRHLAEHADREPRSRERLSPDDLRREAQQLREPPDLVLEELPEWLDELELHLQGQAAHIVVGLDRGRRPAEGHRLDDVGIERALGEPRDVAELARLVLEHGDELGPDALALELGIRHAAYHIEKSPGCVDVDEVHLEGITEGVDDRLGFPFAEEPVVDEDARELVADGAVDEHGGHCRVDAPREGTQHPLSVHLGADRLHRGVDEASHRPGATHTANGEEVVEDLLPLGSVDDLRMELDGVEPAVPVLHRRHRAVRGLRERREAPGRAENGVAVAHPDGHAPGLLRLDALEQPARPLERNLGLAVLAPLGGDHVAAQEVAHRLHAVADTEDGHARVEERLRRQRCAVVVDTRGAPGEDDALVAPRQDLLDRVRAREDLGVYGHFADPASDQLSVLPAEIENRDRAGSDRHGRPATAGAPTSEPAGTPCLRS